MKVCLALAFQNEADWLRAHLPVMAQASALEGLVALDGGSTDGGADYVRSLGGVVFDRPFDWHFAEHMNALIACCEAQGYDALLRTDPDECLFPGDIDQIVALLHEYKALRLARFNFVGDRKHYYPYKYPDYQTRAFRLGQGVHYSGAVHETVERSMRAAGWVEDGGEHVGHRDIVMCPHLAIYHYGEIKVDARFALKHINYARLNQGLPALTDLPPGYNPVGAARFSLPFTGPQPIDPNSAGARLANRVVTA